MDPPIEVPCGAMATDEWVAITITIAPDESHQYTVQNGDTDCAAKLADQSDVIIIADEVTWFSGFPPDLFAVYFDYLEFEHPPL